MVTANGIKRSQLVHQLLEIFVTPLLGVEKMFKTIISHMPKLN